MDDVKLEVFGREITIQPKGRVFTMEKFDESCVRLRYVTQNRTTYEVPINTMEKYSKTADEFIKEYDRLNALACSNKVDSH